MELSSLYEFRGDTFNVNCVFMMIERLKNPWMRPVKETGEKEEIEIILALYLSFYNLRKLGAILF